jgi:hypothetical protein
MEQQLDATYLRSGPFERAAAIGIGAVAIGTGILLAAWGISLLWRPTPPPEITVRITNPELTVKQDKPLRVEQSEPFKLEHGELTVKVEQPTATVGSGAGGNAKTPTGDVIRREVTVFSTVKHEPGTVVQGGPIRTVAAACRCDSIVTTALRTSTIRVLGSTLHSMGTAYRAPVRYSSQTWRGRSQNVSGGKHD